MPDTERPSMHTSAPLSRHTPLARRTPLRRYTPLRRHRSSLQEQYAKYLRTGWWKRRRDQAMAAAGDRCEECGSRFRIRVHHMNYDRLFAERREDVRVLCARCHLVDHTS